MTPGTRIQRRGLAVMAVILLLAFSVTPVLAYTYLFSVPVSSADVTVNDDGSVTLDYYYVFENHPSADPIDAVDIGMPTTSYDLDSISATIDGRPVASITESPYVSPGIALDLGQYDIQPGDRGEVRVHVERVERILFKAKTDEQEPYASFQFQPNYFGSEFVRGTTDMTVTLHLPPGLQENEPRYFNPTGWPGADQPSAGYDDQGRVYYQWRVENANSASQYTFGAAFPARIVPNANLLTEAPFDFGKLTDALCPFIFCAGFAGFFGLIIWGATVGEKKRRLQYLPPKISVEGNGIKRGLTAVEAAILMQQPMDKVLTMILFSVIKKGAATVVSQNPMKIQVTPPAPADLQPYETAFLSAMQFEKPAEQRRGLQTMMVDLVKVVGEKMRGFSRRETVDYYQAIMTKAWAQVEQAQTPEMQMQAFDEGLDWTMLDKRFDDRTRDTFGPRPVYAPIWWGRFNPAYGRAAGTSVSTPSGLPVSTGGNKPPTGVSLPNLPGADFAGSLVTGMQNFSSDVVGNLTSFTGGVTEKTNPVPKTTSSGGSRGGGGRSCACACACAGCACACAGGGR